MAAQTSAPVSPMALDPRTLIAEWGAVLAGVLVLYVPIFVGLANGIWQHEDHSHGPIVLGVSLWYLWQSRAAIVNAEGSPRPVIGWSAFLFGLACYLAGRLFEAIILQVGALIPLLAGILLVQRGAGALRAAWFPVLFLCFLVPIPNFILDALTGPLQHYVSVVAEAILYQAGFPIARNGVILTIGQYQLLVAKACSGLNSMFSLSALGILYLYMMRHAQWWRNVALMLLILPTAFAANIVRVMILVLVTYYFGDEAGQGFVHGFAGMILFIIALLMLFAIDGLLGLVARMTRRNDQ